MPSAERAAEMSWIQAFSVRAEATLRTLRARGLTAAKTSGAMVAMFCLAIHLSVQNRALLPLPMFTEVAASTREVMDLLLLMGKLLQGLEVSTRLSQSHLARRAQLMRFTSKTPKPPYSVGRQTLLQATAQLPVASSRPLAQKNVL